MTSKAQDGLNLLRTRRGALRAAKNAVLIRALSVTLGAFVLLAAILSIDASGFAGTSYLFNNSSTTGGSWNSSANWIPNNGTDYPGTQTGDTAIVDTGNAIVNTTLANPLANLTIDAGSVITLNSTAGDAIVVGNVFAFNSGTVNGPGSLAVAAPAILNFSTSSNTFLGATINNAGTIHYEPIQGAILALDTSAAIHNSGAFNLFNDASIGNTTPGAPGVIHNGPTGILTKLAGTTTIQEILPTLANDGAVTLNGGRLGINANGQTLDSGQFTMSTFAVLEIESGAHTLTTATSTPSAAGPPSISSSGEVQIDAGASLQINLSSGDSGAAFYDNRQTTLLGTLETNNLTLASQTDFLDFSNGSIVGNGDFLLRNSGTWTGGQIGPSAINNRFVVGTGATLAVNPTTAPTQIFNVTFKNQGTVNFVTGSFPFTINSSNTFIHNDPGAIWDFQGDNSLPSLIGFGRFKTTTHADSSLRTQPAGGPLPPSEFFNDGLLEKTAANTLSQTTDLTIHVTNTGTIDALAGTIMFDLGMTQTAGTTLLANGNPAVPAIASPTGTIPPVSIMLNGGTLTGGGTVGGDLNNNSATILPGTPTTIDNIRVTGNYTQGATAALTLKLSNPGLFDSLSAVGSDTLSGALNLQSFGGATASNGETFNILNYGSETGAFTSINPTGLNAAFTVNYFPEFASAVAVVPAISINNVSANEGNTGTTPFTFTVTLNTPSSLPITVNYATSPGTATDGVDYTDVNGTLTFAPGVTSQTITVPVIGDTVNEPDETFFVNLSAPTNATLAVSQGTGTIVNDDTIPALSINSVSQAEGNSGTTPFVFTVILSAASNQTVTVNYATADGTATAGSDYTAVSGTLTFAAGVTSQTITVPVIGDTVNEPDETFTVTLSAPVNANLGTAIGFGTILNDDAGCGSAPSNLSPADNAQNVPTDGVLQWTASPGATSYNIFLGSTNGCATVFGVTSSTSMPYASLAPNTTFQWRVEAVTPSCPPVSSACQTFTTGAGCPTQKPVVISPANGSSVSSPITFSWTAVAGAVAYQVFASVNGSASTLIGSTTGATTLTASLPNGTIFWSVQALFDSGCPPTISNTMTFTACNVPEKPVITANGEATTGQPYFISWNPSTAGASQFDLQESSTPDFTGTVNDLTVTGTTSPAFQHTVTTATPFYYRVRGLSSCGQGTNGPFSDVARVVVIPLPAQGELNPDIAVPLGSIRLIVQDLFIPGIPGQTWTFTTSTDEPWLTAFPTSGILPPEGVTLTVTGDPTDLANGTHTGTVILTLISLTSGKSAIANDTAPPPPVNTAVSINIVTPVTPTSKTLPSPNTLVIPAVGHVSGADSKWQSDIRLTNAGVVPQKYQVTFTPSGTDATLSSKATIITADGGATIALDDIVKRWYGLGSLNDGANGTLEIRPVTVGNSIGGKPGTVADDVSISTVTLASSRTYNTTPHGTFGQFIPALPFSSFVGFGGNNVPSAILSLQQVAQSADFRTNFGIVEGSGQTASVVANIFDNQGQKLASVPISLKAGEHQQIDNFLGKANISNLADGRIEVSVVSGPGKVMSYASVVDNKTNDPLLITGQTVGQTLSRNFVLPGVADLNTGFASWRTDMRIFNPGAAAQATLTFYPQDAPGSPVSRNVTINTNEVRSLDNVLQDEFGLTNVGGAMHITTAVDSPLIVSSRTFDQTANGTFGQFIPAVTSADAVGNGDRSLSILQVEDSDRFRTNLGLTEVTGQPATVEVSVVFSDTKVTPKVQFQLAPNGFVQTRILNMLGVSHTQTYNARLVVRVTGGAGKVAAYGSVIDAKTEDPTYVPAQ